LDPATSLQDLPNEALVNIASFLPEIDLTHLGQCSKKLAGICKDDSLWKPFSQRLFLPPIENSIPEDSMENPPEQGSKQTEKDTQAEMTYQEQVRDFYSQFVMFNSGSPHAKTRAAYKPVLKIFEAQDQNDRKTFALEGLKNNFLNVIFHLNQVGLIDNCWTETFTASLQEKQWYMSIELLKKIPNNINLSSAVKEASRAGRLDFVKELLQKGQLTDRDRGIAVIFAAKAGQKEIIALLLQGGTIPEEQRGYAVGEAASINKPDIVTMLLENGHISDYDRYWAYCIAFFKEYRDIIDLLKQPFALSAEDYGIIILRANNERLLDALKPLISHMVSQQIEIPLESKISIVQTAFERNDLASLEILLQICSFEDSHIAYLNIAIVAGRSLQLITKLAQDERFDQISREQAVFHANGRGRRDYVAAILQFGDISLLRTLMKGHLYVAWFLIRKRWI